VKLIASQIALMNSCQKFFNYSIRKCAIGIKKFYYNKGLENWESIKGKVIYFRRFQINSKINESYFEKWMENLLVIIEEFIKTFPRRPSKNFWNSMVHKFNGHYSTSGPSGMSGDYEKSQKVLNGWLIDFFLFDSKNNYLKQSYKKSNHKRPSPTFFEKNPCKYEPIEGVKLDKIANYCLPVPVFIQNQVTKVKTGVNLLSGFTGELFENNVTRPQISLGVALRELNDVEKQKDIFRK
jgi:hypothetical protein